MIHVITEIYPDCPRCNTEMKVAWCFKKHRGSMTQIYWWQCPKCDYCTPRVEYMIEPERSVKII